MAEQILIEDLKGQARNKAAAKACKIKAHHEHDIARAKQPSFIIMIRASQNDLSPCLPFFAGGGTRQSHISLAKRIDKALGLGVKRLMLRRGKHVSKCPNIYQTKL